MGNLTPVVAAAVAFAVTAALGYIVIPYLKKLKFGQTILDMVRNHMSVEPFVGQVREMAAQAKAAGLNIDYFPANFVVQDGLIYYVDYECNDYMDQWNFENWGIKYWSRTAEFEEYLKQHKG